MEDRDLAAAHRHFSTHCFNEAWKLLERAHRSREEDETMIRLSLASHWHWSQREDYTPRGASIGHWQTSRIYAVLGQADAARRYAEESLRAGEACGEPFYMGYAYEALARAEAAAGRTELATDYRLQAEAQATRVTDPEERQMLLDDLATITMPGG